MFVLVLLTFVDLFATVFYVLLISRVLMSYVVSPENQLFAMLVSVTEPVLVPLRRVLPPMPGVDLAPLVAFLILQVVQLLIHQSVGA